MVVGLQPDSFVMENVLALEWEKYSHVTSFAWKNICEHYHAKKWSLVASDYGVPQKRKRLIWIGYKQGEIKIPSPSKHFTVKDAIADLEDLTLDKNIDSHRLNFKGEYVQYLDKAFSQNSSDLITGCAATIHNVTTINKYARDRTWEERIYHLVPQAKRKQFFSYITCGKREQNRSQTNSLQAPQSYYCPRSSSLIVISRLVLFWKVQTALP